MLSRNFIGFSFSAEKQTLAVRGEMQQISLSFNALLRSHTPPLLRSFKQAVKRREAPFAVFSEGILGLSNGSKLCYHLLNYRRRFQEHQQGDRSKMIQITEIAKKRINVLKQDQETNHGKKIEGLRLMVKSMMPSPEYALAFVEHGKIDPNDLMVEVDGIHLYMESRHANLLEDVKIDFITGLQQTGFKVENPKVIQSKPATPSTPPNLESPQAKAVQRVLDTEINPAVAAHGGYISLVDVKDDIAYIRLGGGCQGCGMANVTMKQGVVVAIKKAIPEIKDVLDVTDHAGGSNPYYSPGK